MVKGLIQQFKQQITELETSISESNQKLKAIYKHIKILHDEYDLLAENNVERLIFVIKRMRLNLKFPSWKNIWLQQSSRTDS